jgi:hypothetical protein
MASKSKLGEDGITKGDLGIFLLLLERALQEDEDTFLMRLILLVWIRIGLEEDFDFDDEN